MRRAKAFTLIELLVVISVIALLMAILLPTLRRARNQVRAVVCQSNLKQWGTILDLYTEENQGLFPWGHGSPVWLLVGSSLSDNDPNKIPPVYNNPPVYHNVRTEGIACCPMAVRADDHASSRWEWIALREFEEHTGGSTFEAWEITSFSQPFRSSYGFNQWLFTPDFGPGPSSGHLLGLDIYSIRGKANIPTLLDSTSPATFISENSEPPETELDRYIYSSIMNFCINRHNGYVNGLFLDWSVRKIGLKELWTLKWNMQFNTANEWTKAGGVKPEDWPVWMRNFKDY